MGTTRKGGTAPRLTARQRSRRATLIFADAARGRRQEDIADAHGVSVRQVQRIIADCRRDGLGVDVIDPVEEIRSTLEMLRQVIADLARIESDPDNDAAHIGATRLKVDTKLRLLELLQALGVMPSPRTVAVEQRVNEMFAELTNLIREHDLPDDFLDGVVRLGERGLRAPVQAVSLEAA